MAKAKKKRCPSCRPCRKKRRCKHFNPKPKRITCCKPRALQRKAYQCFLHKFKLKHCNWSTFTIQHEGKRYWCKMRPHQKLKYYLLAKKRMRCIGPIDIPGCKNCKKVKRRRKTCAKKRKKKTGYHKHYLCRREDRGCDRGKRKCCRGDQPCPR